MKNSAEKDAAPAGAAEGADLIAAIRAAAEERIARSRQAADSSIQTMTDALEEDLRRFDEQEAEGRDRTIAREVAKIKNRSNTDRAKRSLILQNECVLSMIDNTVALLRADMHDRYYPALSAAVCAVLSKTGPGSAVIHVAEEDAALREALPASIDRNSVVIDNFPEQGGAVVFDCSRGIRYDISIRRIIHRNMNRLQKEMQALINEHTRKQNGVTPPGSGTRN